MHIDRWQAATRRLYGRIRHRLAKQMSHSGAGQAGCDGRRMSKWHTRTETAEQVGAAIAPDEAFLPMHRDRRKGIVRARAPLRLGLAGGGTDLADYCDRFGGAVLNATIDRYAFAFIAESPDGLVHFHARDIATEETHTPADALASSRLPLHRGAYEAFVRRYNGGKPLAITVTTTVDSPPGSGFGSSSALMVALVEAYATWLGVPLGPYDVAHLAFEIERIDLKLSGGKQDQFAAAFGGVNFIEFFAGDRVIVNPLRVPGDILNEFESSLAVCFSGQARNSDRIITLQNAGLAASSEATLNAMHQLKEDAAEMKRALLAGDIRGIGKVLGHSWLAKKETAEGISSPLIEKLLGAGLEAGAFAGKVSGAGGGGFLMFVVPPEKRFDLIQRLNAAGGVASPVKFTAKGSETWIARG